MKLKLTIKITALLLCLVSGILSAQETPGTPNELDKLFVPDKNSIFNSSGKTGDDNSNPSIDVKNVISFNPIMLPRGIAAFYYQRRLNDQISLQGGLGSCFNKDRILSFVSGITDDFANNNSNTQSTLLLNRIMQSADFSSTSLFASFSLRLNWTSYYWDYTPYFEINTRYYSNKLKLSQLSDGGSAEQIEGTPDVTIKNICFNLIYGFQYLTEGKIKTSHDFYFGMGMRSTSYDKFSSSTVQTPGNYSSYTLYTETSARATSFAPSFIMGYAFGIGF